MSDEFNKRCAVAVEWPIHQNKALAVHNYYTMPENHYDILSYTISINDYRDVALRRMLFGDSYDWANLIVQHMKKKVDLECHQNHPDSPCDAIREFHKRLQPFYEELAKHGIDNFDATPYEISQAALEVLEEQTQTKINNKG